MRTLSTKVDTQSADVSPSDCTGSSQDIRWVCILPIASHAHARTHTHTQWQSFARAVCTAGGLTFDVKHNWRNGTFFLLAYTHRQKHQLHTLNTPTLSTDKLQQQATYTEHTHSVNRQTPTTSYILQQQRVQPSTM